MIWGNVDREIVLFCVYYYGIWFYSVDYVVCLNEMIQCLKVQLTNPTRFDIVTICIYTVDINEFYDYVLGLIYSIEDSLMRYYFDICIICFKYIVWLSWMWHFCPQTLEVFDSLAWYLILLFRIWKIFYYSFVL